MSDQIDLFPVESLPNRPPPPMSLTAPSESAKDPGCYLVRARFRDGPFKNLGRGLTFATLSQAQCYAERLHVGWNNRKIYHIADP